jgi:hypothetical protein
MKPDPTPEELRRWSAEVLMGWVTGDDSHTMEPIYVGWELYIDPDKPDWYLPKDDWHPLSDQSPTWQIKAVIEKMREREFYLETKYPRYMPYYVNFYDRMGNSRGWAYHSNPFHAILLAAWRAVEP